MRLHPRPLGLGQSVDPRVPQAALARGLTGHVPCACVAMENYPGWDMAETPLLPPWGAFPWGQGFIAFPLPQPYFFGEGDVSDFGTSLSPPPSASRRWGGVGKLRHGTAGGGAWGFQGMQRLRLQSPARDATSLLRPPGTRTGVAKPRAPASHPWLSQPPACRRDTAQGGGCAEPFAFN